MEFFYLWSFWHCPAILLKVSFEKVLRIFTDESLVVIDKTIVGIAHCFVHWKFGIDSEATKGENSMNVASLRRWTGIFGLVAASISLVQLPLYFMYSDAPPQWNILTRILISIIGSTILIVFLCGFRLVIRAANADLEWAATIVLVSGLMWLTFSSVAQSMEAGTTIVSKVPIDPTINGVLAPGQFLLWGSIGRAMTALFLSASGMAILRGRLMPAWFGRLAWILALVNVAFLPSMFFGSDAAQFYSAVGWGTTATIPALVICWILVASIFLVRTPGSSAAQRNTTSVGSSGP